jgi:hypothetical protein
MPASPGPPSSDPGVGDADPDPVATLEPLRMRRDSDRPLFRELIGVACEIKQRLPEAGLVGVELGSFGSDGGHVGLHHHLREGERGHAKKAKRRRQIFPRPKKDR